MNWKFKISMNYSDISGTSSISKNKISKVNENRRTNILKNQIFSNICCRTVIVNSCQWGIYCCYLFFLSIPSFKLKAW